MKNEDGIICVIPAPEIISSIIHLALIYIKNGVSFCPGAVRNEMHAYKSSLYNMYSVLSQKLGDEISYDTLFLAMRIFSIA